MAKKRVHVEIHGYVQGVGFRYFARETANELGLIGWVRNRSDGAVEVVAEGEEGRLARFVGLLKQGPFRADVESTDVTWSEPTGEFDRFYVKR
jgi:acylphosphatase